MGTAVLAGPLRVTKHGPNCYNSALTSAGVLNHLRYVSPEEFGHILKSPVCREVSTQEVQPGDLRVYFYQAPGVQWFERILIHANVYLSPELSLNKMTMYLTSQAEIQKESEVRKNYQYLAESRVLTNREQRSFQCTGESCQTETKFYRCSAFVPLLQNSTGLYTHYQNAERSLEEYLTANPNFSDEDVQSLLNQASNDVRKFEHHLMVTCDFKSFPCSYFLQALESMKSQISLQQPPRDWLLKHFQNQ